MKKILIISLLICTPFITFIKKADAFGECSEYGVMAVYDGFSSCKCMSGYAFGKDFLGNKSCVSVDQLCKDQFGYNATSDYGSDQCKCRSGYSFGKTVTGRTQCISLDTICQDKLGYSSRYNSLYDKCECSYGDIIKDGKCTNADNFCTSEHGLYSSYNSSKNQCECDSGYTVDGSSQCIKKQNNVYFTLKELDTDNKKAVIRSDYDYGYYLISYNSGCYTSSFRRYLNDQIVVNLGTDFSLDTWDKIVLQDDDEVCDITSRERVDSSFSLQPKKESDGLTADQILLINQMSKSKSVSQNKEVINKAAIVPKKIEEKVNKTVSVKTEEKAGSSIQINPEPTPKIKWYKKIFNKFKKK